MTALARRGGQGVYLSMGPGGLPHGQVHPGEPMMFDALGTYKHYHGDLGRTVVAGEPSPEIVQMNKAMQIGWQTVLETVKPGITASELASIVLETIRKNGFPGYMLVAPHSVGLEHTDHPLSFGPDLPGSKGDLGLQQNMVINVDLPYYEIGFGSLHIEDTIRVTADGCEVLTSGDVSLRVIPG
jgi:Xaa-Pro aminopeptidase